MARGLSETLIKMIIKMYEEDTPVSTIAEELRVDKNTIYKYLREAGVYEEDLEHARKSTRRFSYLEKEKIIEMYNAGEEVADISDELDTSPTSLYRYLNREGLSRQSSKSDIQRAVDLYNSGKHTVQEVLDHTGVSRATLYRHLKKQ